MPAKPSSPGSGETAPSFAILGAPPLFAQPLSTGQLANRDPARFFTLAEAAFERRWLTNQGPLVAELEDSLRQLHGAAHCVTFANACFALTLALRQLARPGASEVLLPALTFRGLPHVIRWAGLTPVFCDVEPEGLTLDAGGVAERLGPRTAAVLAVDNVQALSDVRALEAACAQAGVPLILDSVYGVLGAYADGTPVGSRGACSVFSLHATKLINGFEGGYLTTDDGDLAAALRRQRTFGFDATAIPQELGMNAKLNEIHAAMALSNLPHAAAIAAENRARFEAYRRQFASIGWVSFADYSASAHTYSLVLLRVAPDAPYSRDELIEILRAENALVRPFYSPPLHLAEARPPSLPVAERAAEEYIQMPVGDQVTFADIDRLGALFEQLDGDAASLTATLRGARR